MRSTVRFGQSSTEDMPRRYHRLVEPGMFGILAFPSAKEDAWATPRRRSNFAMSIIRSTCWSPESRLLLTSSVRMWPSRLSASAERAEHSRDSGFSSGSRSRRANNLRAPGSSIRDIACSATSPLRNASTFNSGRRRSTSPTLRHFAAPDNSLRRCERGGPEHGTRDRPRCVHGDQQRSGSRARGNRRTAVPSGPANPFLGDNPLAHARSEGGYVVRPTAVTKTAGRDRRSRSDECAR